MQTRGRNRHRRLIGLATALVAIAAAITAALVLAIGRSSVGSLPLRQVTDLPLPGGSSRFDYQSIDVRRRLLFVSHLAAGEIDEVDLARRKVVATIPMPDVHGVLVAPRLHRVYATATAQHELVTVDELDHRVVGRGNAGVFPDAIAYDPADRQTFVADTANDQVGAFDARSGKPIARTHLPGGADGVQYDASSRQVLVDIGERDEIATLDPQTHRIVGITQLPGCAYDHALHLDAARGLAFVTCVRNRRLLVLDLRTRRLLQTESIGANPDVLDFDPGLRRLYVASESGTVSVFAEHGRTLAKIGQAHIAREAHSVAVDPRTHLVYFPLENLGGRAVLRIMRPTR